MKEKFLVFALCLFSLPLLAGDWIEFDPHNLKTDKASGNYLMVQHDDGKTLETLLYVNWKLRFEMNEVVNKAKNERTQVLIKLHELGIDSSKKLKEVMCAKLVGLQEDD